MALPATFMMKAAQGPIPVPVIGFGTWAAGETSWCEEAVLAALNAGYRHLDCAWHYGVDKTVGSAIRQSGIPRSEIFITSKFWPQFGTPENVEKCLDFCLRDMNLEYIDLFLAHWPFTFQAQSNIATAKVYPDAPYADKAIAATTTTEGKEIPIIDWAHCTADFAAMNGREGNFRATWEKMQALVGTGKVRAVGVSNYNVAQLQEVLSVGGSVPLSCNQIEAHPWFPNTELLNFMKQEGILATVYSPFAGQLSSGKMLLDDAEVQRLAAKNEMGVGQLLQSWAVQRGTIPLGKSQHAERIKANLDVRKLPEEDMDALNGMDQGREGRTVDQGPVWGIKIF